MNENKKPFALVSPATRQFVRAAWEAHDHSLWAIIHSYVYARWPYLYIGIGKGDHPIAKKLASVQRAWRRLFRARFSFGANVIASEAKQSPATKWGIASAQTARLAMTQAGLALALAPKVKYTHCSPRRSEKPLPSLPALRPAAPLPTVITPR